MARILGFAGSTRMRSILANLGVLVLPEQVAGGGASQAFDAAGELTDPAQQRRLEALATRLAELADRLST